MHNEIMKVLDEFMADQNWAHSPKGIEMGGGKPHSVCLETSPIIAITKIMDIVDYNYADRKHIIDNLKWNAAKLEWENHPRYNTDEEKAMRQVEPITYGVFCQRCGLSGEYCSCKPEDFRAVTWDDLHVMDSKGRLPTHPEYKNEEEC